jgi:hypothetical protein
MKTSSKILYPTFILLLILVAWGCGNKEDDSKYQLISRNWIEKSVITNGTEEKASGRQHIFKSNLKYRYICAINEYCTPVPDGDWSFLNDSTLQTIYNSEIKIYIVDKLDGSNLWLRPKSGKDRIQIRCIPL